MKVRTLSEKLISKQVHIACPWDLWINTHLLCIFEYDSPLLVDFLCELTIFW